MAKKRIFLSIFSFLSLAAGLLIYLVFRNDTFIHAFLPHGICDFFYVELERNAFTDFVKFYLCDFLWAFSFSNALTCVSYSFEKKRLVINALLVLFCGVLFEVLQHFGVISGTFDFADILAYAVAAVLSAAVSFFYLKGVKSDE